MFIDTLVGIVVLGVIAVVIVKVISKRQLQQIAKEKNAPQLNIKKMLKEEEWQFILKKIAVKVLNFYEHIVAWFKEPARLETIKNNNNNILAISIKEKLDNGKYNVINCLYDKEEERLIDASKHAVVFTADSLDLETLSKFGDKEMILIR
jgi:hypothetical protein